ncbi:hypothetical protein [Herbaspirillum sp. CF444]|uniref:hypothetical protein n=1 Tax=Herbaspirillum sp. CF444 TaxID=1144319 RepID=UPI0012F8970F|nr:hypothetical protein [Herbaspirillum sp. CF444]
MKNQQTIVDNKNCQSLQRQYALKIVATRLIAVDCAATRFPHHIASWCSQGLQSSILVQALTKLLPINLSIVDNSAHRYDSCSGSGGSAIFFH